MSEPAVKKQKVAEKKVLDVPQFKKFVNENWEGHIEKVLMDYIRIPNQSPQFDAEVFTNGYQDQAVKLMVDWVNAQKVEGLKVTVVEEKDRTPLIFLELPSSDAACDDTVLLYGHLDKQPPMADVWEEGLGPWTPVIRDGKMYGRGGADDGYAIFAAVTALKGMQEQGVPHARCVILVEACEESGSRDLPYHIDLLKKEIGTPSLVVCLDSGCGNYDQLWLTTSLRGMLLGELNIKILNEAVHSGSASGVVPSTFRIMRELLDRVEDSKTGKLLVDAAFVDIPEEHLQYAKETAETLGKSVYSEFTMVDGAKPMADDLTELILNRTWRPTISYTGINNVPKIADAGNVLRTHTTVLLSVRLPPTLDPTTCAAKMKEVLEANPPYGAQVTFNASKTGAGWSAPKLEDWLKESINTASQRFYGQPVRLWSEGGSIPFMGMLGRKFPGTQFVITGVLGPGSNAHGPNEFLHIESFKNVTGCVASILADHYHK